MVKNEISIMHNAVPRQNVDIEKSEAYYRLKYRIRSLKVDIGDISEHHKQHGCLGQARDVDRVPTRAVSGH